MRARTALNRCLVPKWVYKYVPIARPRATWFTRAIPRSASAVFHVLYATNLVPKFNYGTKLWAVQNIFAGHYLFGHILGKTLLVWWWPHALAMQACPWGHSPSSSAPCVVPMRLSRIGQHIKDEPCAKQRALLCVLSSRLSSVSLDIRSTYPIWNKTPLVHWNSYCSVITEILKY